MDKDTARALIETAAGRAEADLVIRKARIVNVFTRTVETGSVAVRDGYIAGFGSGIHGKAEVDAGGRFLIPGLIDSHCHIESSHLSPSEYSDAIVPGGTTTVIADPHEICNVCGMAGLDYMLEASEDAPLSVFLMVPSCVPATPFEHSGAIIEADDIAGYIGNGKILGLGEMMNYPGVAGADDKVLAKLDTAYKAGKRIDGHAPSISGDGLDAYIAAGITTDHECETPEELREKASKGMYVMLRQGTACRNVLQLLPGVDESNWRRMLFCTDDCQPQTMMREGALINGIHLAIGAGLDPLTAIAMATLNASECYGLRDRGAISPGRRADFFLSASLEDIRADEVWIAGRLAAEGGKAVMKAPHVEPRGVSGKMDVRDFSKAKLSLKLASDRARCIDIIPGGVVTGKGEVMVRRAADGEWIHDSAEDVLKLAVIERHHGTGNAAAALIRGYGMKHGAVATSIAHDSHNIIVIGDNDDDMEAAVRKLISIGGGITMFMDGKELGTHVLEIAGLMTDEKVEDVVRCLDAMHEAAYGTLGVNKDIDPFMTLCFMALPVIPALKLTDCGLFDVEAFGFVSSSL